MIITIVLMSLTVLSNITLSIINPLNLKHWKVKKQENQFDINSIKEEYRDLYLQAKKNKKNAFISFFIWITIIGLLIYPILNFIGNIKILVIDWKDEELNKRKILWGVLSLLLLRFIGLFIFTKRIMKKYESIK